MNDWIRQKKRERDDVIWHDRIWWLARARKTKTDWSSLLRQRLKVMAWLRAGRPPLRAWLRSQVDLTDRPRS